MIYLDNNATTRVADEVLDAMRPYYTEAYGNPHSAHSIGQRAHEGLEKSRAEVARLLHARPEEVFFTSCGTESNALALRGFTVNTDRRKVIITAVEHPSVSGMVRQLADSGDIRLAHVGVDHDGRVDLEHLASEIDDSTALVAVMQAQNETGVIHDVAAVAELAHRHGAMVLVDAVQCAGKIPVDVGALGADFLSISGHKLHAPKGIGAIFIRRGLKLAPLWRGGGQEAGLRSGTEPVPLAVGLARAAALAMEHLAGADADAIRHVRDRFEENILAHCPIASVNGSKSERLPNTSSISFEGLFSDEIIARLDREGICASAGAACHSGTREPSAVMKSMHTPLARALGTVRFSLSRYTTAEEMARAAGIVLNVVRSMRGAAA